MVGLLAQERDRVGGEERRVDALPGRLPGDRLGPFSQNSAWLRFLTAGSPQAQLGQSNPSAWFTRSRVRIDRAGPISDSAYRIEATTPGTPTAADSGSPIRISSSSTRASLIVSTITESRHVRIVAGANEGGR